MARETNTSTDHFSRKINGRFGSVEMNASKMVVRILEATPGLPGAAPGAFECELNAIAAAVQADGYSSTHGSDMKPQILSACQYMPRLTGNGVSAKTKTIQGHIIRYSGGAWARPAE